MFGCYLFQLELSLGCTISGLITSLSEVQRNRGYEHNKAFKSDSQRLALSVQG
ncbi:hypothetical protein D042_1333 [Vibrio parahaemolyticus NIHCB0757]|nr:hypothetical protein D042_1333 [Vibrio parahaemolyticus NIHCB0757]